MYKLALPLRSNIHNVFVPELLSKATTDLLSSQENPKLSAETVDTVEEYEVEEILAVKLYCRKLCYQVSWVGHDPDSEWYPASNLKGSSHLLKRFYEEYLSLPEPLCKLSAWLFS